MAKSNTAEIMEAIASEVAKTSMDIARSGICIYPVPPAPVVAEQALLSQLILWMKTSSPNLQKHQ